MKNNPICLTLLAICFATAIARGQTRQVSSDTAQARLLLKTSAELQGQRKYAEALDSVEIALDIYGRETGKTSLLYATALIQKGRIFSDMNAYDKALMSYKQALAIRTNALGEGDLSTAITCSLIGNAYYRKSEHRQAIAYFYKALRPQLAKGPEAEKNATVASLYNGLGANYVVVNNPDSALYCHRKALSIRRALFGNMHDAVAASLGAIGNVFNSIGNYREAIPYYDSSLLIRRNLPKRNMAGEMLVLSNLTICYHKIGMYDKAIKAMTLVAAYEKIQSDNRSLAATNLNLGAVYIDNGKIDSAIYFTNEALQLRLSIFGDTSSLVADCYYNLGNCYLQGGQLHTAIGYFQKAKFIWEKFGSDDPTALVGINQRIGVAYSKLKVYDLAIASMQTAYRLNQRINLPDTASKMAHDIYNDLGLAYKNTGKWDSAYFFLHKGLQVRIKKFGEKSHWVGASYHNLAGLARAQHKYTEALELHQKSQAIQIAALSERHPTVARTYNGMGDECIALNREEEALIHFQKALLSANYTDNNELRLANDLPETAYALLHIGNTYLERYHKENARKDLLDALEHFQLCEAVTDYQLSNAILPEAVAEFTASAKKAFEGGLEAAAALYQQTGDTSYLRQCFNYFERAQNNLLRQAFVRTDARHTAGVDTALLHREDILLQAIQYWESKKENAFEKEGKTASDSTVTAIFDTLFDLHLMHQKLLDTLRTKFPAYYGIKFGRSTISLRVLQDSLLKPDQGILEYFVGERHLFVFYATRDTAYVVQKPLKADLRENIRTLLRSIYEPYENNFPHDTLKRQMRLLYHDKATALHHYLLNSITAKFPKKLTIIPDGLLGQIPFEALLTEQPRYPGKYSTYPFLGKTHEISYCYSAGLLYEMRNKQHLKKASFPFLGFAPLFKGKKQKSTSPKKTGDLTDFGELRYSKKEVQKIDSLLHGRAHYDLAASEFTFKAEAAQAQIIHLSTHGIMDSIGAKSYLVLMEGAGENGFLSLREIYTLRLNADLVVLSACQAGIGPVVPGEGMISLARAFSYAGAKSIVASLWSVSDERTMHLMVGFYNHQHRGFPTGTDLWEAKNKMIADGDKDGSSHPYYWAGFIGIGF